jgi:ankyrin repeat protein
LVKIASRKGLADFVRLLLKNGASVDSTDKNGRTALYEGEKFD